MTKNNSLFIIGEIINTHGVKGEVKIKQISDFDDRFAVGSTVYLEKDDGNLEALIVQSSRLHKQFRLVSFEQYDSINAVESLKGATLYIKEEQLTELGPNEYYYHEIIGCKMYSTEGEYIGAVRSILSPGANDVWVVDDGKREYLIPYIPQVVKEVDPKMKRITIEIMEGLLD